MIKIVSAEQAEKLFANQKRVYYSGKDLQDDGIKTIENDGLEIALTRYRGYSVDLPHYHKWNDEYNFIKSGQIKVYLIDEKKEYSFGENDLYMIEPDTKYAAKAIDGTEIVVVKSPGGNDKVPSELSEEVKQWQKTW